MILNKISINWVITPLTPGRVLEACHVALEQLHTSIKARSSDRVDFQLGLGGSITLDGVIKFRAVPEGTEVTCEIAGGDPSDQRVTGFIAKLQTTIAEVLNATQMLSDPPAGNRVFVSYRRNDSADAVGRIYDRLISHYGGSAVFKDVDTIPLGVDFRRVIDEAVSKCTILLVVIGGNWLTSTDEVGQRRLDNPADFVRLEIESALRRDIAVIPLLVGGAAIPREMDLPESLQGLAYRNGIAIRPDPDFHKDMDRLLKSLDQYLETT